MQMCMLPGNSDSLIFLGISALLNFIFIRQRNICWTFFASYALYQIIWLYNAYLAIHNVYHCQVIGGVGYLSLLTFSLILFQIMNTLN